MAILFLAFLILNVGSVVSRPQWNPSQVDSFRSNENIKKGSTYSFLGYDRRNGIDARVFGTKNMADTTPSASLFITQNAETNVDLVSNQKFSEKILVFGNHEKNDKLEYMSKTIGASHKFHEASHKDNDSHGIIGGRQKSIEKFFENLAFRNTFGKK